MFRLAAVILALCFAALAPAFADTSDLPQTVHFQGPGGQDLVGYLFLPAKPAGRVPALVMMHGRAGPYSSAAKGVFDATTLSKVLGFVAVVSATTNLVSGYLITDRMLKMFKKREPAKK